MTANTCNPEIRNVYISAYLPFPHVQFWWTLGPRLLVLVSASLSNFCCHSDKSNFDIKKNIMVQKLEAKTAGLKPTKIVRVVRAIMSRLFYSSKKIRT